MSGNWKRALLACTLAVPVLAGCATVASERSSSTSVEGSFGGGGSANLFPILDAEAGPEENVILSPASIDLAFGLLHAGARGETRLQLEEIVPPPTQPLALESDERDVRVSISNALFLDQRFGFRETYLEEVRSTYDASAIDIDFRDKGATADTINQWADDATEGLIPKVIEPFQIKSDMIAILANALYFEGLWPEQFDAGWKRKFLFGNGEDREFGFMGKTLEIPHTRRREWEAIRLPYRNPRYAMDVIIPRERVIMETSPSLETIRRIKRDLDRDSGELVAVSMPEFEADFAESLVKPLESLGLTLPFDGAMADLSDIAEPDQRAIKVGDVRHVTKMQVFDEGTKAAAVTTIGVVVVSASRNMRQPIPFVADRPFVVVLRDLERDAILFLGRIADPEPYERED